MIDVIPARPFMAERLKLQSAQVLTGQTMTPRDIANAIEGGMALAAVEGDRLYAMAGIYEIWEGRGMAWALLADDFAERRLSCFKLMKRALDVCPLRRVEAYVADAHVAGENLLRHLGFEKEGVQRMFWQDRNFALYARIR
jgi:hypothetical protein